MHALDAGGNGHVMRVFSMHSIGLWDFLMRGTRLVGLSLGDALFMLGANVVSGFALSKANSMQETTALSRAMPEGRCP